MKISEEIVTNIGGLPMEYCSRIDKIKWYLVIIIIYIFIAAINGKYRDMLHSGVIIKYDSYKKWYKRYITDIFCTIALLTLLNVGFSIYKVNFFVGFLCVLLITLNFTVKGILMFFLTGKKNNNIIMCVFFAAEAVFGATALLQTKNIFYWSMLNRSNMVLLGGFNIVNVVFVEIFIIAVMYLKGYLIWKRLWK